MAKEGITGGRQGVPPGRVDVAYMIQLAYEHGQQHATRQPMTGGYCTLPNAVNWLLLGPVEEGLAALRAEQVPHLLQRGQGSIVVWQGFTGYCRWQRGDAAAGPGSRHRRTGCGCAQWGDGRLLIHRLCGTEQIVDQRAVALASLCCLALTGAGVHRPGVEF